MDIINLLIGEGKEINSLQMSVRTIIIFITALLMLRLAGIRTFGKKTAMDNVIIIMLGAVLSRAIAGASPFLPTICASLVMVLMHRLFAMLTQHNEWMGKLIKGEKVLLFKDGKEMKNNMRKVQISHNDILEEARIQTQSADLSKIAEVYIERTGEISFIKG